MILRTVTLDILSEWMIETDSFLDRMRHNIDDLRAKGLEATETTYEELLEERWLVQEDLNVCADGKAIVTRMAFGEDPNVTEIL